MKVDIDFSNFSDQNKQSLASHIVEFIQTLAVFAAIGAAIYYFIAQPHKVSGPSMLPTFKSGDYIITDKVSYLFSEPERGDIVVFKNPRDEQQDFIKRVIGVPGDRVKIQNKQVYLNSEQLEEPYLKPNLETDPGLFMPEGKEVTVEPGHLLVMGDNRPQSSDSRAWGFITNAEVIGKVFLRYWPLTSIGIITKNTGYQ